MSEENPLDVSADDQQDDTASVSSSGTSASKDPKEKRVPSTNHVAGSSQSSSSSKRMFSRELRCMMYGFGDDQNPYTESVELLEDLVVQFMIDTTAKAMETGKQNRVQVEDIIYLTRNDPRKYARINDLLSMNDELKRARKAFDEKKYG